MNYDELMRAVLELLPQAELCEDNEGQIVVYTGLKEQAGQIVEFECSPE